jgi:oligopeptide transport system permease protein
MAEYVIRRLLWLVPVLFFVSIVTFVLMHSIEGGPWDEERPLPPRVVEALDRKYGLDKPVWQQYLSFAGNALQGDLGISYTRQDKPVTEIILTGLRVTAVLGLCSLALAVVVGVSLGVLSALHRNGVIDYLSVLWASAGSAVPAFVLAVFLIYIFGVKLHWLPTFGWDLRHGVVPGWLPRLEQMVLPVITLAALPTAYLARVTRASLLEVLNQDYMRTARAKGLGAWRVMLRHALPNASIPILTLIGPLTAGLVTGSFIVEQIYSVPGTGRLFVQSISARDYGLIMGTTLFYAVVVAMANLAVDVAYAFVNPRIRYR